MSAISAIYHMDRSPVDPNTLFAMQTAAQSGEDTRQCLINGFGVVCHGGSDLDQAIHVDERGGGVVAMTGQLHDVRGLAEALGVGERTFSHSALLWHAYRKWGPELLDRVDGEFAFVIYDSQDHRLLAACDFLSVHPLHYRRTNGSVVLASHPGQVLAGGGPARPSEEAIAAYLSLARHLTTGSQTFYEGVHRIRPAHWIQFTTSGSREVCYWRLDPERTVEERPESEMADRVRHMLLESVRRRAPVAPPYACALSGGFDSSTVAGLFRQVLNERGVRMPLETFSFELRDREADEPDLINAVAEAVQANHHHVYLDRDNVFDALPEIVRACGGPTRDMGLLYLWRKKQAAAAAGAGVVLSGLGGDEVFFGRYHFLADLLRAGRLWTLYRELCGVYPVDRNRDKRTSLIKVLRDYTVGPLLPRGVKRMGRRLLHGDAAVQPWIHPRLAERTALADRILTAPPRRFRDAYRQDCWEVFDQILVNVTLGIHASLGQASGVETRFPLLDRQLVEYMFAAPREQKIRDGRTRALQRRAMDGILPEVVVREHLKKNMNPVLWRQQHQHLVDQLRQLFAKPEPVCAPYFNMDDLRARHQRFAAGQSDGHSRYVLWYALNIERWIEQISSTPTPEPVAILQ